MAEMAVSSLIDRLLHLLTQEAKLLGGIHVSLAVDYMGKAGIGDWLEFDTDFVRAGRTLCFAGARVTAQGQPIARAHATFRVHTSSSS